MELRSGYKKTEVGVIPEDWEIQSLKNVSTISRLAGAEYTSVWKESPNGEIIALRGFNIGQGKIIERDLVRISNKLSLKLKRSRLCKGDVVYPCVGSIGNAVVINEDSKYHIQQNIARITPEQNFISPYYLAHYLMSSLAEREVGRFTSSSSQPSVLVGSLRQYLVPLPPTIAEQHVIATALADVDALIASLDRLTAKKRDIKQATMQELLTGKRRLLGFSGEWEVKRLGDITQIVSGGTPKTGNPALWNGTVKWCTPTDITGFSGKYLKNTERHISFEGLASSSAQLLPVGSLLLCSRATIGELKIAGSEICTNQGFKSLICKREVDNEFMYYKLLTMKSQIIEQAIGSTFLEISKKDTANLELTLPPLPEQTAIATILSDMDADIATMEQKLDKTRMLKQGMMQELLTGRIRLI